MQNSRLSRPRALVEVAWILVQKRWQKSAANHDVRHGVCSIGTEPFAEPVHSLTVIGSICRLLGAESTATMAPLIGSVISLRARMNFSLVVSGSGFGS